ncbi:insulinase family protein [Candidatus Wolfebacteria bacterium]|nr:insulinase family protein [Candidatus Wolfebacteria bacterium]
MYKKITLPNGLRVLLIPQKDSLSTTVLVLVETGSKYETKEINGLSHFLEHMCFKGTKKRPKAIDISSELDGIGAAYNAFTSQEYTGYFVKIRNSHLDIGLDVVSDIYLNQLFEQNEIEKERGVIIEEINMYEDLPMDKVQELFTELLYGDQPAGWSVAGRKEVIKKLGREDFVKYHNANYVASATTVIVAGNFNEEQVINGVKKAFGGISTGAKSGKIKTVEHQEKPQVVLKHKETDQTHLVLGTRAFDLFDKRKYAIGVLSDILGGSMSSRLFQRIREQLGAAYYIHSSDDLMTDHGFLDVSAGIDHNKIDVVIEAVIDEFKKLAEKEIPKKELERAKEHLIGGIVIGLETSNRLASYYGMQEILEKEIITPEELIKKIQGVTAEEIQKIAKEIFKNEKLNLAIIGPFKEKERFEKILKF